MNVEHSGSYFHICCRPLLDLRFANTNNLPLFASCLDDLRQNRDELINALESGGLMIPIKLLLQKKRSQRFAFTRFCKTVCQLNMFYGAFLATSGVHVLHRQHVRFMRKRRFYRVHVLHCAAIPRGTTWAFVKSFPSPSIQCHPSFGCNKFWQFKIHSVSGGFSTLDIDILLWEPPQLAKAAGCIQSRRSGGCLSLHLAN